MGFDPQKLLAMPLIVTHQTLTMRDTLLYALGVGATELDFIFEERVGTLPTMAVVMAYPGFIWGEPEFGADWRRVLHGEQSTVIHKPLPAQGRLRGETLIEAIYDKGVEKGSVAISSRRIFDDENGDLIATVRASTFLRGDGGRGGSDGSPPAPAVIPDQPADTTITLPTTDSQAAIYRLSGDFNPLHIDPTTATAAGFPKPILHGLCTYGVAGRALLAGLCENDPHRLKRIDARFSAPVFPGETIVTEIWRTGAGVAAFRAKSAERDLVVLNNGYAEFLDG